VPGNIKYDLVLQYLGQSLLEMQKAGSLKEEHLMSVMEYKAWIHSNVSVNIKPSR